MYLIEKQKKDKVQSYCLAYCLALFVMNANFNLVFVWNFWQMALNVYKHIFSCYIKVMFHFLNLILLVSSEWYGMFKKKPCSNMLIYFYNIISFSFINL